MDLLHPKLRLLLLFLCSCSVFCTGKRLEWADDDTIIIEATREQDVPNIVFERNGQDPEMPIDPNKRYGGPPVMRARAVEQITCYSSHGDEGLCSTFQDCYPMVFYKDEEHMNEIKHPVLADILKANAGPCIPPPMSFRDDFVPGGGYYLDESGNYESLENLICCPSMKGPELDYLQEQRITTTTTRRTTTAKTTTRRPPTDDDDDEVDYVYSDPVPDAAAMINLFYEHNPPPPYPTYASKKDPKKPPKVSVKNPVGEDIVINVYAEPTTSTTSTTTTTTTTTTTAAPETTTVESNTDSPDDDDEESEESEEKPQQTEVLADDEKTNYVTVSIKTGGSSEEVQQVRVPANFTEPIDIPVPPPKPVYPAMQVVECGLINNSRHDPPHPWIVALQLESKYLCTGSIIDAYHVLTAAHCIAHLSSVDVGRLRVYLGERVLNSNVDGPTVIRKVQRAMRHRGYSISTLKNDIAVLRLNLPIPINTNRVKPICLNKYDASNDAVASIVGWGSQWNDVEHDRLIENQFRIWPNEVCAEKYKQLTPDIHISDDMLCAQYYHITSRNHVRQISIYDVDSAGSPLIVKSPNGRYEQIGINSWRIRTNSTFPFVLTRISAFPEWIAKNCARPL